jgi:hypothetical protein
MQTAVFSVAMPAKIARKGECQRALHMLYDAWSCKQVQKVRQRLQLDSFAGAEWKAQVCIQIRLSVVVVCILCFHFQNGP